LKFTEILSIIKKDAAFAQQQDLFNISVRNGSSQSYYEFKGQANKARSVAEDGNAGPVGSDSKLGTVLKIPTTGSLLVLNPVYDFSLPSYLSASSLGQYQFQFNLTVSNQYNFSIQPEICIITVNSGIFATQQGTSQIFTGILTKEQVLRTKEQNPVPHLDSGEYKRLVGGKMSNRGMGNVSKMSKKVMFDGVVGGAFSGGSSSGGASCGGKMSGGSVSVGGKSKSKLAKHFA